MSPPRSSLFFEYKLKPSECEGHSKRVHRITDLSSGDRLEHKWAPLQEELLFRKCWWGISSRNELYKFCNESLAVVVEYRITLLVEQALSCFIHLGKRIRTPKVITK